MGLDFAAGDRFRVLFVESFVGSALVCCFLCQTSQVVLGIDIV